MAKNNKLNRRHFFILVGGLTLVIWGGSALKKLFFKGEKEIIQPHGERSDEISTFLNTLARVVLPGTSISPSGVELGVQERLIHRTGHQAQFTQRFLKNLTKLLKAQAYFELTEKEQQTKLLKILETDKDKLSESMRTIANALIRYYYSDPRSWKSLKYKNPQPDGYPHYQRCDV